MALATGSTPALPPDPLQLKRRLALQGGGFALLLLAAFSASLYWGIALQRREDQRSELRQLAASAAAQLPLIAHETREPEGSAKFRGGRRLLAVEGLERLRLEWFDAAGHRLSEQGTLPLPSRLEARWPGRVDRGAEVLWQHWQGGMSLWQPVYSRSGAALGAVHVALSDQTARADLARLRRGLLLGGIVTLLAALLVGRRMLRAAFSPLQEQLSALQQFTADASHELRHPLTALRTLLAAVPGDLRQQPGLAWRDLDALTGQMGQQLDDLLLLAGQRQPQAIQRFDLLELLEDLVRCYQPQASTRGIRLQLSPDPATASQPVRGRSQQLLRLFTNLVVNAIRHSPEGGTVTLALTPIGRSVQVAVIDQGPGIPLQQRDRVFDRCWRGSDRGGHSGLGLAIARAIARRHGGELRLGESRPGHCELLVELPCDGAVS